MPVDPTESVETEEVIEPEQEFGNAFDDEQPEVKDETSFDDADVDTDSEETTDEQEEDSKEPEGESKDDSEEELSALEIAERAVAERLKASKEEKETSEEDDKTATTKDKVTEEAVEIDFTDVDRDPRAYAKKLVEEVTDPEKKESLNNLMETYPEIFDSVIMVARDLVSRQKVKVADGVNLDIGGDLENFKSEITELKEFRENFQRVEAERVFFDSVESEVPGARAISSSEEFNSWLDSPKQSVGIRMLSESSDPKDAVMVLRAYNEYKTRMTAKQFDEKSGKDKAVRDASLKGTSSTRSKGSDMFDSSIDDFDAGFNE